MKKLILLLLFIPLLSCGGGDKNKTEKIEPLITKDTPSTKVDNLNDLITEKLCFGNKLREKEYWNKRVIEISGEISSFSEDYILVWDVDEVFNDFLGYGTVTVTQMIKVFLDKKTILKLNPKQKVRVKGVLNITGNDDKMCDPTTNYITSAIVF